MHFTVKTINFLVFKENIQTLLNINTKNANMPYKRKEKRKAKRLMDEIQIKSRWP